jgi:hypothetical protein
LGQSRGAVMNEEKHGAGVEQAWGMLNLFAGLDAHAFDLTTTDVDGRKRSFRRAVEFAVLRQAMPGMLDVANRNQHNLIVRPRRGRLELVQLDDLSGDMVERMRVAAFMILATSPGNHQAWVAVAESAPGVARRLRQASGADPSASGATRVAGSVNFKREYAPEFPIVRLLEGTAQRSASETELQALGLIATPKATAVGRNTRVTSNRSAKAWPSYERCLQNAPRAHNSDRADVSRADFTFCLLAIDWGWSMAATRQRLLEISRKARENGVAYVRLTVERAAAAVARRSTTRTHLL